MKRSLSHTVWECKYHIVWVPKKRRKIIYGKLRNELRTILKPLQVQKCGSDRRKYVNRPYPHLFSNTAKIFSINHSRVPQRQKRNDYV